MVGYTILGERIFVILRFYLNQYQSKSYWYQGESYLGMEVLVWHIDPNDIKNTTPYILWVSKSKLLILGRGFVALK